MSSSKTPSQNKVRQQKPPEVQKNSMNSTVNWTFGYPKCINSKQSRLVCLHEACQKFPFFCSSCEDQSCENEHQHKDRITSIGFKELIKRLITQRKPPEELQRAINQYKTQLQQLQKNVNTFVDMQVKSMDDLLKKTTQLQDDEEKVIAKLRQKKYQQIKGKQLDKVWKKVAVTQQQKKLQKQMIEFIDSKKVQVQQMKKYFQDGINSNNQQKTQSKDNGKLSQNKSPSNVKK